MFSPFRRIAPNVWILEDPPGMPLLLIGFGSASQDVIDTIVSTSYAGASIVRGIDHGPLRIALLKHAPNLTQPTLPGVQPAVPIAQAPQPEARPMTSLDLMCQRPMGHDGPCGKFSESDRGSQTNAKGQLIPSCLKPLTAGETEDLQPGQDAAH